MEKTNNEKYIRIIQEIDNSVQFIMNNKFEKYVNLLNYLDYKKNYYEGFLFAKLQDEIISSEEYEELSKILRNKFNYNNFQSVKIEVEN